MILSTTLRGAEAARRLLNAGEAEAARAREAMILRYIPLVKYVVGHMRVTATTTLDYEDLLGYGMLGLIDAVDRFDAGRQVKFETYAVPRIRGYIVDRLRDLDPLSRSCRRRAREVERAALLLEQEKGRPARADEVGEHLGVAAEEVRQALVDAGLTMVSLDAHLGSGEEGLAPSLLDHLVDDRCPNPSAAAEGRDVSSVVAGLPAREQEIIRLHYGQELTLKEISRHLGISESRVCQLHARALALLRARFGAAGALCAA